MYIKHTFLFSVGIICALFGIYYITLGTPGYIWAGIGCFAFAVVDIVGSIY